MEVTRSDIFDQIWAEPMGTVAARYGLSGNGLAKICDRLAIPRPPRSHWTRAEAARDPQPTLPPPPLGLSETFALGQRQIRRSPGSRTRMTIDQRRKQLLDAAAELAMEGGISAVVIRDIAARTGISETQVHNCFGSRTDLLVALARREIETQENRRRDSIARGANGHIRIMLSTVAYLHGAARRGPLLQMLLRVPEVREALRGERATKGEAASAPIIRNLTGTGRMDEASARAATRALTAVVLRAGGIVAGRRAPLGMTEELCLNIVMAGHYSDNAVAGAKQP